MLYPKQRIYNSIKKIIEMKKLLTTLALLLGAISAFSQIKWIPFEEAMNLSKQDGKPILIDVYTDWCGWCKRLDATTYKDSAIIGYINEKFHAVKFNAETKESIKYQDSVYVNKGKTHDLALKLMNGQASYPTTIYIVPQKQIIAPVPGYQTRDNIQPFLFYFGEAVYDMTTTWDCFLKGFNAPKL